MTTATFTVTSSAPFVNPLGETVVSHTVVLYRDGAYADRAVCGCLEQANDIGRAFVMKHADTVEPAMIVATLVHLKARARQVPKAKRAAHFQIAQRAIKNAALLAHSNTDRAATYCWDARFHLNHCE